jgi:hypothetical protein
MSAFGASSGKVAIGQEAPAFLGIPLPFHAVVYQAAVEQVFKESLCGFLVIGASRSTAEYIEFNLELVEQGLDFLMPTVEVGSILQTLLFGLQSYGYTVLIGPANIEHIMAGHSQIADVNICREVSPGNVPEVNRAIGVGEG